MAMNRSNALRIAGFVVVVAVVAYAGYHALDRHVESIDSTMTPDAIPADGVSSALLEVRLISRFGNRLGVSVLPAAPSIEIIEGNDLVRVLPLEDSLRFRLVAGFERGRVVVHIRVPGIPAPLEEVLLLTPSLADRNRNGYPDAVDLTSTGDRTAFRRWFVAIALGQLTHLDDQWNDRDCAGLVRFCFREALKRHDNAWLRARRWLVTAAIPDVQKYNYPAVPLLGERVFNTGQDRGEEVAHGERHGESRGERRGESRGERRGESRGQAGGDRRVESHDVSGGDRRGESGGQAGGDRRGESHDESGGYRRGESRGESGGDVRSDARRELQVNVRGDVRRATRRERQTNVRGDSRAGEQVRGGVSAIAATKSAGSSQREAEFDGLRQAGFATFAEAARLKDNSMVFVSREEAEALPGDVLFYLNDTRSAWPYHVMVYVGNGITVYHTGPDGDDPGIVKRMTLAQLAAHPNPRWHPVAANPYFLGYYRWRILL